MHVAVTQRLEREAETHLAIFNTRWVPGVVVEYSESNGVGKHLVSTRFDGKPGTRARASRLRWVRFVQVQV